MSSYQSFILGIVFGLNFMSAGAQSYQQMGAIPSLLFSQEINRTWDLNLGLSSQALLTEDVVDGLEFPRKVRNINLQTIVSYDRSPALKLDFGFLIRKVDPFDGEQAYEMRPWQQATIQFYMGKYRLRNRFRIEERFFTSELESTELDMRLRYRLSMDFPLSGERLDKGEFYINGSLEALSKLDQEDVIRNWENRCYFGIGHLFSTGNRLELGPEIRYKRSVNGLNSTITYWRMVWVHALDLGRNT